MFNTTPRLQREPISAGTAALITAGSQLAGTGLSAFSQGSMNRKTRKWNEKMYDKQRQNALADWQLQNQYNSPREQIQRMREAGLNPALMYKNMPDNTASTIKTPDMQSWNPRAANYDSLGDVARNSIGMYQDFQTKKQTLDNLTKINENLAQEKLLKQAQTNSVLQNTKGAAFDYEMKNLLKENTLSVAESNLKAINQSLELSKNKDIREAAINASNIAEAAQRILGSKEQIKASQKNREYIDEQINNLKINRDILNLDKQLKEKGLWWNDDIKYRVISTVVDNIVDNKENIIKGIKVGTQKAENIIDKATKVVGNLSWRPYTISPFKY